MGVRASRLSATSALGGQAAETDVSPDIRAPMSRAGGRPLVLWNRFRRRAVARSGHFAWIVETKIKLTYINENAFKACAKLSSGQCHFKWATSGT